MKYEDAARAWGAVRLKKAGVSFSAVDRVRFSTYTDVGCPTCGPETHYEGDIFYMVEGNSKRQLFEVEFYGLDDILKELFELSEE